MANHSSSKKAIRKIESRTLINKNRVSRIRTFVKKVETLIETGAKEDAFAALRIAEKELMRGAQKGVLHANKASRSVSRLSKRVKAIGAA